MLKNIWILLLVLGTAACQKDPYKDVESNEKSIEAFTLGNGLVQIGPAEINRSAGTVTVKVLMQGNTDLSNVRPSIQSSYKASISPASGEPVNFTANGNKTRYTVRAESGQQREWTVEVIPFTETILGTYAVTDLVVYGGTGPEYNGAAVLKMTDKPWIWPAADGPAAELDNQLTFTFGGVTAEGNTFGTISNTAGADGKYANFLFTGTPQTDVNNFYRTIPKGEGKWTRNYVTNTVTFTFSDGKTATGKFVGAGTTDLGNGAKKTVVNQAFEFTLNGTDDWGNIYSDLDKFVKKPRTYWIDVKKN
ncbi:hypothetical protein C7T94_08745 [Pedobacter yulinensis]|uniref:DUF5018 domain-containing protein n=2 Tax=Pedobacter yulinensis TaxID=2126353 RepID=A0A2T3HMS8_9SPHI|nr:hypothetical protein C7T94_08745 [Pedobacter yulinensis]